MCIHSVYRDKITFYRQTEYANHHYALRQPCSWSYPEVIITEVYIIMLEAFAYNTIHQTLPVLSRAVINSALTVVGIELIPKGTTRHRGALLMIKTRFN